MSRDKTGPAESPAYRLDEQIGFVLRQVVQRHAGIFAAGMEGEVTAMQWAALAKLDECGPLSQNLLGRRVAMDAATIKGVIDRLSARGFTETRPDPTDRRRHLVALTTAGDAIVRRLVGQAVRITEDTLAPLDGEERVALAALLAKLC